MGAKSGRNKRGGRGGPKKATPQAGGRKGGGAAQRVGLILFAVVFVALFVVFAVAEGLGAPSVPSGDIALVSNAPEGLENISEAEYKASFGRQWAQAGLKKAPKAGSKKAEELHKASIEELLSKSWIFGEAEELGIKVTQKEVEKELEKVKKESFKTEKAFQEFLKEQNLTEEEVNQLIELRVIQPKIQEKVSKEAPPVTEAEAKAKYEEEEATAYTKPPSRDVRVVVNEDKKEVEEALKALEADNSEASWKKVTKKYSPTTEANAGLQKEITEEFLTEPLKKDIFSAKPGEVVGPVKQEKNYLLLEVAKVHPESVQPFSEVKTTITTTLTQEAEQKYFTEWVAGFQSKWTSRTHCASGFVIENCANFKGSSHPSTAPASCYEADPKKPPTECPAPVTANQPAVPGTVTVAEPEGERKPQGPLAPRSAAEGKGKKAAEKAAEGAAGAEEGSAAGQAETEAAVKAAEEAAAEAAAKEGK
ncbi:MAG TPA: peptidyl-prolyl cis-trans isomerase [Solirubrobacterales bacterium]|nr:peptidyl-prolyl cis-trans isomerase [Solirubrobacterales bacterium]